MRFIILFLFGLLSACSSNKNASVNQLKDTVNFESCYSTKIELPSDFVKLDGIVFTHTWYRGCDYSNETDEESISASYIHIKNDFSTKQFATKFSSDDALAIAKHSILDNLSWAFQYGGIPEYFEKKINGQLYYCYSDHNKEDSVVYTNKRCFTFNEGVLLDIGYVHSSKGNVSIEELERALSSVFR